MLTQKEALELLEYRDGNIFWKKGRGGRSKNDPIGSFHNGYKRFETRHHKKRKNYLVHRVIYVMHHGFVPEFIDHIDGDRANNKIENLRQATKSQNAYNKKLRSDSVSGYKGVHFDKIKKIWYAKLFKDGKSVFFSINDDAIKSAIAYDWAARHYFGEFALTNFNLDGTRNELFSKRAKNPS
jgi:hypothetical protein